MGAVMVRYGEIFLKREPVKRRFISIMTRNIGLALEAQGLSHRIETPRGRILIFGDEPLRIAEVVARTFGVVSAGICEVTAADIPGISAAAVERAERRLHPGMSFAVRARRSGVEGFNSQELAAAVGAAVLARIPGVTVNLTAPTTRSSWGTEFGGFVYDERIAGPGGLPYGTQGGDGPALGGHRSPVASWLMIRGVPDSAYPYKERAVRRHGFGRMPRHPPSPPGSGHPLDLLIVDMEPFFEAITALKNPLRCILCERFMLRWQASSPKRGAYALVNGDNLGQVASQTLANMAVVSAAGIGAPALIGFDKDEVVGRACPSGRLKPGRGYRMHSRPRHPRRRRRRR